MKSRTSPPPPFGDARPVGNAGLAKGEVIARLAEAFRRDGYDGASLVALSSATGLSRSSLYYYFPGGKAEMAHAVLDQTFERARREIFASARSAPGLGQPGSPAPARLGSPAERLAVILHRLEKFYAYGGRACIVGRFCASADRAEFHESLTRFFRAQTNAISRLLVEASVPRIIAHARAEHVVVSIQGALLMSGGIGDAAPFHRAMSHLRRELLRPLRRAGRAADLHV